MSIKHDGQLEHWRQEHQRMLQHQAQQGVTSPMTNEEYARYSPWQQQRAQDQHSQTPPPGAGYVWQPYAMGGGQWVVPTPVRLSDEDVARIADAVVLRLRADTTAA